MICAFSRLNLRGAQRAQYCRCGVEIWTRKFLQSVSFLLHLIKKILQSTGSFFLARHAASCRNIPTTHRGIGVSKAKTPLTVSTNIIAAENGVENTRFPISGTCFCFPALYKEWKTLYIYIHRDIFKTEKNPVLHTCPALEAWQGLYVLANQIHRIQSSTLSVWVSPPPHGVAAILEIWQVELCHLNSKQFLRAVGWVPNSEVKTQHAPAGSICLQKNSPCCHHYKELLGQIWRMFPELGRLTW